VTKYTYATRDDCIKVCHFGRKHTKKRSASLKQHGKIIMPNMKEAIILIREYEYSVFTDYSKFYFFLKTLPILPIIRIFG